MSYLNPYNKDTYYLKGTACIFDGNEYVANQSCRNQSPKDYPGMWQRRSKFHTPSYEEDETERRRRNEASSSSYDFGSFSGFSSSDSSTFSSGGGDFGGGGSDSSW